MDQDFQTIATNGINLRVALTGAGPLVLLIHGWPESWYSWRHQIKDLVHHALNRRCGGLVPKHSGLDPIKTARLEVEMISIGLNEFDFVITQGLRPRVAPAKHGGAYIHGNHFGVGKGSRYGQRIGPNARAKFQNTFWREALELFLDEIDD